MSNAEKNALNAELSAGNTHAGAEDIPVPPAGSPLEAALKKASMEACTVPAEETQAEDKAASDAEKTDAPSAEGADAGQTGTESEHAPAQNTQGSEGDTASTDAAADVPARTDGTAPVKTDASLPAEQEDNAPAEEEEDEDEEEDGEGGRMSIMDHLRELRKRLFYSLGAAFVGFLACWAFVEPIFDVLTQPLLAVLPTGSTAMYTTLPEAFFTRMYIAFIAGLFFSSPYIFYQIWAFISPGLYEEEKGFIIPVALVSAVFFIAGGLFCYFIVFHYAFSFFMSFTTADIVAMPKISDYLDFVLKLILAFGLIFEMPIFTFFLSRMGVVTAARMRNFRRYAILLTFIVAAILTPPDVVSQTLMAIPMLLLYEVSILVAVIFGKKPASKAEKEDEDEDGEDAGSNGGDATGAAAAIGTAAGAAFAADQTEAQAEVQPEAETGSQPAAQSDAQPALADKDDKDAQDEALYQSYEKAMNAFLATSTEKAGGSVNSAYENAMNASYETPQAESQETGASTQDDTNPAPVESASGAAAEPGRYAPWDPKAELQATQAPMDLEAMLAAEAAAGSTDDADRMAQDDDQDEPFIMPSFGAAAADVAADMPAEEDRPGDASSVALRDSSPDSSHDSK